MLTLFKKDCRYPTWTPDFSISLRHPCGVQGRKPVFKSPVATLPTDFNMNMKNIYNQPSKARPCSKEENILRNFLIYESPKPHVKDSG